MAIIDSIRGEYQRYRALGEAAMAQLDDAQLVARDAGSDNSIAIIVWHIAGNLKSRFTDFLTSDGEKPWRDRDQEFAPRDVSKAALAEKWNDGWDALATALGTVDDDQLFATITIRNQPMLVHDALHRSLAHAAYHVGQIVYLAKAMKGDAWTSLSIPPGKSAAYNLKAGSEKPDAQAEMLRQRGLAKS